MNVEQVVVVMVNVIVGVMEFMFSLLCLSLFPPTSISTAQVASLVLSAWIQNYVDRNGVRATKNQQPDRRGARKCMCLLHILRMPSQYGLMLSPPHTPAAIYSLLSFNETIRSEVGIWCSNEIMCRVFVLLEVRFVYFSLHFLPNLSGRQTQFNAGNTDAFYHHQATLNLFHSPPKY